MAEPQLALLEAKLNQLIELCQRLDRENAGLKAREATWQQEKLRLVEKNELARSRVEAMIKRLKSMESEG
ncbi:TIGR02449 family protein [Simiduia aestuariiviva]|uniref:Cell division protein ZapB n=1 Tax=Simiduia aestuariiviva TaxID=1510459 RepID=A0A839UNU4_9GAMM|nr:TIGR02449 family protein [Simiduia aestuariiviva]MBB3167107.1 cell division protein ZapB [Simiduia aestuariiviva]